jgi:DNA-binding response OmpR family regulator
VLIVDDDPSVTQNLRTDSAPGWLRRVDSTDGETGLREIQADHPDVVLLDLRMPLVDGLDIF